jgi:zinc/manganese transport system substrate-binding protein
MQMKRLSILAAALVACLAVGAAHAAVNVFACEPEWASLASEIGGDKVSVFSATTGLQDPHRIEARPSLIARMRTADLMICSGADLEVGWLPVLLQSAGNNRIQVGQTGYLLAAQFVPVLDVPTRVDRSMGDIHAAGNPHVHLDPRNIARVAPVLVQRLAAIDPGNAAYYLARLREFDARWQRAITEWDKRAVPLKGMKVVPYHKDTTYLINWLGMVEVATVEPKPGVPPSAGALSELLGKLKAQPADAILRATHNEPKAPEWLAQRTGMPVVVIPYTVGGTPDAKDLFSLFDITVDRLLAAKR